MSRTRTIVLKVLCADALDFPADVLALKHAQGLYGVDRVACERLTKAQQEPRLPRVGGFTLRSTNGILAAPKLLFVGVQPLRQFGYAEIREFGRKVLASLAGESPHTRHVALTIHGAGYGLDEIEAFESELAGIIDAIRSGDFPEALESVSFVERNRGRAGRLSAALKVLFPRESLEIASGGSVDLGGEVAVRTLEATGARSDAKPHVFVAMPFASTMDDIFHYGIQGAAKAAGLLCERADSSSFTGEVMERVKVRIASANLVVADLTGANPNVYLEVGYAWGKSVPTVLLVQDTGELKFDVRGQRCIPYNSIKDLEQKLAQELSELLAEGPKE